MTDEPNNEQSELEEDIQTATLRLVRDGSSTPHEFVIWGKAVIGRFDPTVGPVDIDLADLPEGVYISRKHAEIAFEDGKWLIRDLGSSNKTFVQNPGQDLVPTEGDVELSDGQQFSLGNARFSFHIGSVEPQEESTPMEEANSTEP